MAFIDLAISGRFWGCPAMLVKLDPDLSIIFGTQLFLRKQFLDPETGYALSVSNTGVALPEDFDPAACKGLGMKIIESLVRKIGGDFGFGRGADNQGARFVVLFS